MSGYLRAHHLEGAKHAGGDHTAPTSDECEKWCGSRRCIIMDDGIMGGEQGRTDGRGRSGQGGDSVSMHKSAILSFINSALAHSAGAQPI